MKLLKPVLQEKVLKRKFKLIVLSALISIFISLIIVFMIKGYEKSGFEGIFQTSLFLPIFLILIVIFTIFKISNLLNYPEISISDNQVIRRFSFPVNLFKPKLIVNFNKITQISIHKFLGSLNIVFYTKNSSIIYPVIYENSVQFIENTVKLIDNNKTNQKFEDALIKLKHLKTLLNDFGSSPTNRLNLVFTLNLPILTLKTLYLLYKDKSSIDSEDLQKLYLSERKNSDILKIYSLASSFSQKIPGFSLPKEDLLRVYFIFKWKKEIFETVKELKSVKTSEIPPDLLEDWYQKYKYGKVPAVPYSGIMSKVMSGHGIYITITKDGTIKTREGNANLKDFVGLEIIQDLTGIKEAYLHSISGKKFLFNKEIIETISQITEVAPHILVFESSYPFVIGASFKRKHLLNKNLRSQKVT